MRPKRQAVEAVLDRLDHGAEDAGARDVRRHARQAYRDVMRVELEQPAGNSLRYAVYTRNISRTGIGFLTGQFIYPRTRCRVYLVDPAGSWHVVRGTVARCRYLPGTVSLHEVGVSFHEPFDISMLEGHGARPACRRVLLATADPPVYHVAQPVLEDLGTRVTRVSTAAAAIDAALANSFDLVLLDLELPDMDGLSAVQRLRAAGCNQPVVAVAACEDKATHRACRAAGCMHCLSKPVSAEAVRRVTTEMADGPLTSSLAEQPELAELVDYFVLGLPEKVARLERAFEVHNLTLLGAVLRILKAEGAAYGFNLISVAASELEQALQESAADSIVREVLTVLIGRCRAARPVAATKEVGPPAQPTGG